MHDGGEPVDAAEPVDVRVKTRHMLAAVREILGMPPRHKTASGRETRTSPRVAVKMPFSYQAVRNDLVMPDTFQGTMLDISHNGMMAELNQPLPDRSEIKLNLEPLLRYIQTTYDDAGAAEIYARITSTRSLSGRNVSGLEFICLSGQNRKLLMHCMLHIAHADNKLLDEDLRRHEQAMTKRTEAWRLTKRIVLVALLGASSALFYLIVMLNNALTAAH